MIMGIDINHKIYRQQLRAIKSCMSAAALCAIGHFTADYCMDKMCLQRYRPAGASAVGSKL